MLSGSGIDLHLFPTSTFPLHDQMRDLVFYGAPGSLASPPNPGIVLSPIDVSGAGGWRARTEPMRRAHALARVIEQIQPDIVHAHEVRHGGTLAAAAKAILRGRFPPLIVSCWGSDLSLYGRLPDEAARLRKVLVASDYFTAECARDFQLARELGFVGETLWPIPIAGGYDLDALRDFRAPGPTSARRTIALKGFQHWAGRARVGLRAIERCGQTLAGYRVALYLADPVTALDAEILCQEIGIELDIVSRTVAPAPYEEILRMHGRARVSIGLSAGDAISTSFLEAIMMGAFPIQSCTACVDEWIDDGIGGSIVPPEDPDAVAAAIRQAVEDDALVDRAAEINERVVRERLPLQVVLSQMLRMYEHVLAQGIGDSHRADRS